VSGTFFTTLNYSSVNEDWRSEAAALRLGAGDVALCITGGGDRPLNLLALAPRLVVAIDANPAQTALLDLKAAALRRLPFVEYAAFLGLHPAARGWRLERLAELTGGLSPAAAAYWRRHARQVARGVLYAGRWEVAFGRLALLGRALRPRAIPALLRHDDLEEQRRFVREVWDRWWWRRVYDLVLSRPALRLCLGDPAFWRHAGMPAGRFIYERMRAHLERVLARDSFMVSLLLRGRLSPSDLPPYLTPEGAARIRENLDRLEVVTGDVVGLLEQDTWARRFHAFSLSDVASFLDQGAFERLLEGVLRCAAPRARFCLRLFLSRQEVPARLARRLVRDGELERRLAEEDHGFAYDFIAGHVA